MDLAELQKEVLESAQRCARRGPGYSQQRVVLNEIAEKHGSGSFQPLDIELQQAILTCWHDLFRDGKLSWGYDLENPDTPFFHVRPGNGSQG